MVSSYHNCPGSLYFIQIILEGLDSKSAKEWSIALIILQVISLAVGFKLLKMVKEKI